MSRTAALVKHSPRSGKMARIHSLTAHNAGAAPYAGAQYNTGYGVYGIHDGGESTLANFDLGKTLEKLGGSADEWKKKAAEAGIDLNDPKAAEEFLNKAKTVVTGEKAPAAASGTSTAPKKPRNKEEATQSLMLRAGVAVGTAAIAGVTTAVLTKNVGLGVAAGAGGLVVAAVTHQVIDPLTKDELDKVFASDAAKPEQKTPATQEAKKP